MKYQPQGAKSKDFLVRAACGSERHAQRAVLKEVVQLMENNNASLTKESFEKIKQMVSRKNSRIAIQSPQDTPRLGRRVEKRSYSTARLINKEPQNKTYDIKFNQ
jgi:hypothetical protein